MCLKLSMGNRIATGSLFHSKTFYIWQSNVIESSCPDYKYHHQNLTLGILTALLSSSVCGAIQEVFVLLPCPYLCTCWIPCRCHIHSIPCTCCNTAVSILGVFSILPSILSSLNTMVSGLWIFASIFHMVLSLQL